MLYVTALIFLVSLSASCHAQEPFKRTQEAIIGSAFFVSKEGHLLTCEHCIKESLDYSIFFQNKAYPAQVIYKDVKRDVAILKINAKTSEYLTIRSSIIPQGSDVRAFGYPLAFALGDQIKVTRGTLAGTAKVISNYEWLQVDVLLNPGNSGGALVDEGGLVVGITNAKLRQEFGNMGFAVPVHVFSPILDRYRVPYDISRDAAKLEGPALVKKVAGSVVPLMAKTVVPNLSRQPLNRDDFKRQDDGFYDARNTGGHFSDHNDHFGITVRHVEGNEAKLIGFKLNVNGTVLRGIQPIYLKNDREHYGTILGDMLVSTHIFQARSGYAVSSIHALSGSHIDKLQLVFSKIKGDVLDTKDSYSSTVAGNQTRPFNSKRDSGGRPIVGIHAVTNDKNWPVQIGMVVGVE
jgi:hypothetical protein